MLAFFRKLLDPRRLSRRRWAAIAIVLVVLVLHTPILRALAWPLIVHEPSQNARFLCLRGGEHCVDGDDAFPRAADWYHADPARRILVLDSPPSRLVEAGILPSLERRCRTELGRQGVPDEAIQRVPGTSCDDWDNALLLGDWLREHPGERISLLCSRFGGARLRCILDKTVERSAAARIRISAPPIPQGYEVNWWRSRWGIKDFMYAWLSLIYAWCEGEQRVPHQSWSISDYRAILRKTFGEAPP
jgi:hypothetical protein